MGLDWKVDKAPMIPIYFCDEEHLFEVANNLDIDYLGMMLEYYVYFEKYKKAGIINKIIKNRGTISLEIEDMKTQKDFEIPSLIPGSPNAVIPQDNIEDDLDDMDDENFYLE